MKLTAKIVLVLTAVLSLVGCQKKSERENDEDIKLQLYYYKQENVDGLKNVIHAFENANPGVHIELLSNPNDGDVTMQRRAAEGDLPDILQIASYARVREYASKGYLEDLTSNDFMQRALPSSLDAVRWNGKCYAIPMDYAGIGVLYNKDIFKNLGLEPPKNFNELKNVCAVLKQNDIAPFAVLLKENWSMGHYFTMIHTALLRKAGINPENFVTGMNAGKGSYGDVDTRALFAQMDYYRDNMNKDAANMNGDDQQKAFANGKAAMMVQGLWAYVGAKSMNPKLNAGFIPYPAFADQKDNVFYADVDSAFAISSQSSDKKKAIAFEFLKWLTGSAGQEKWMKEYKLIPPFKGVNVSSFGGPYVDLMSSVESKGSMIWAFSQYPTEVFDGACKNAAQAYMLGKTTSSAVIDMVDEQWSDVVTK